MPSYKTSGLVLKRLNLGEADRLITFLSPEHGQLKAVAKGVRKIGSRLAGHLELFSAVELMLAHGRNLDIITSARLQFFPEQITANYQALQIAYGWAELLDKLVEEGQPSPGLFALAGGAFKRLEQDGPSAQLDLYVRLGILKHLGVVPQLEVCASCHRPLTGGLKFDSQAGGAVHAVCGQGPQFELDLAQRWVAYIEGPWSPALSQQLNAVESARSRQLLDTFYSYTFNRQFKTAAVMERSA